MSRSVCSLRVPRLLFGKSEINIGYSVFGERDLAVAGTFGPLARLHHDVADRRVILQGVHAHVLAVAGLLESAMGHLVDEHEMAVHPGAAVLQARRRGHGP